MRKRIQITESELTNLIKRVINENQRLLNEASVCGCRGGVGNDDDCDVNFGPIGRGGSITRRGKCNCGSVVVNVGTCTYDKIGRQDDGGDRRNRGRFDDIYGG